MKFYQNSRKFIPKYLVSTLKRNKNIKNSLFFLSLRHGHLWGSACSWRWLGCSWNMYHYWRKPRCLWMWHLLRAQTGRPLLWYVLKFNRYRRELETCPREKTSKSGYAIFFFFSTRPSDEYDSAPSRKYSRPL